MWQHLLVGLVFALCLYWLIRHIVRYLSHVKKGKAKCSTCSDTSCPLCCAQVSTCGEGKHEKKKSVIKNCKKKVDINLSIQK